MAGLTLFRLPKPSGGTPPKVAAKVEHRVGVRAPAEVVWSLLADIEGWPAWQPVYPEASGALKIGGRLTLVEAIPGEPPRALSPTILDWMPEEQILWAERRWGGLVRAMHYIEIEALTDIGCALSCGEVFHGLLGDLFAARHRKVLKRGFRAFCEAVQPRAEALWRERGGAPTSQS